MEDELVVGPPLRVDGGPRATRGAGSEVVLTLRLLIDFWVACEQAARRRFMAAIQALPRGRGLV